MVEDPGLGIIRVGVSGDPIHAAHPEIPGTEQAHAAMLAKGTDAIGALWYSLLRSDSQAKMHHRRRVLARLVAERDELDRQVQRLQAHRASSHGDPWDKESGLVTWDLIGVVAEFCESLAATFSAERAHLAGEDGGLAMLALDAPPHRVFKNLEFGDIEWWKRALDADDATVRELTDLMPAGLKRTYQRWVDAGRERLETAIATVRQGYTHEVHRVAQRRKHAASYVSPWHGYMWMPKEPDAVERVNRAIAEGAFVVLDGDTQWVVPSKRAAFDLLVSIAEAASWLVEVLSAAIVGRAENPTSRTVLYPDLTGPDDSLDKSLEITRIVTGTDQRPMMERSIPANEIRGAIAYGTGTPRQGRNELCSCGSGKKFKRCHGNV